MLVPKRMLVFGLLLTAVWSPLRATNYTIPNTNITIDISGTGGIQLTTADINSMLGTLSLFPPWHLQYLRSIVAQTGSGGITLNAAHDEIVIPMSAADHASGIASLTQGLAQVVYYNLLTADDRTNFSQNPARKANPTQDFVTAYNNWYTTSLFYVTAAINEVSGGSGTATLYNLFFVASLFADSSTQQLWSYCQVVRYCGPSTRDPFGLNKVGFTWDSNELIIDTYHFSVANNQVVTAKNYTEPTITLIPPLAIPTELLSNFAPSRIAPTRDSKLSIQVRDAVDANSRFSASEKSQLLALLATMPSRELQGIKLIQSQPLSARPKDLPSGQVCDIQGPEQSATMSCYLVTGVEIDMNHQLLQLMGGRYYDSDLLMGSGDRLEWGGLWDHGGKDRQDYQNWYENFMIDSAGQVSQAAAALNVSGAPLQVSLFTAAHFFNPSNNTVSFTSRDARNILTSKAQPVKWADNTVRFANFSFQVQRIDNPDDPNYGRFLIVSVQADGAGVVDLSANPVPLPDAFVGVVPQQITAKDGTYTIPKTRLVIEIRNQSTDPNFQFMTGEIQGILVALSRLPVEHLQGLLFIESRPNNPAPYQSLIPENAIAIDIKAAAVRANAPINFDLNIPAAVAGDFMNRLSTQQVKEFQSINPLLVGFDPYFAFRNTFYTQWVTDSYATLLAAVETLKKSGDVVPLESLLFIAQLFADPVTGKIPVYLRSSPNASAWVSSRMEMFTWAQDHISIGTNFRFNITANQLVSVQVGQAEPVALKSPMALWPSMISRFTFLPLQSLQTSDPKVTFPLGQVVDLNYRLTSVELSRLKSVLLNLKPDHFKGITLIRVLPDSTRPSTVPAGQVWSMNGTILAAYVTTADVRATAPIDMRSQLPSVLGVRYFNQVITTEKPEWGALWNHGANVGSDFGAYYSQWVVDSKGSLAAAYDAVAGGNSLPMRAVLYVASFFVDVGQNTVEFNSFDPDGLLVSSRQPVTWVDNNLTLGDYRFQTQGNLVVSIQLGDQEPFVLVDPASLPLPAAFRGKVPHTITQTP